VEDDLTVFTLPSDGDGKVLRFNPAGQHRDARADWEEAWPLFERKLLSSQTFSSRKVWKTNDLGAFVLYRAIQRSAAGARAGGVDEEAFAVLGEDVLADAISDVFTSVYMMALAREGLVPLGNNRAES